jgi:hypothetical protein
LLVSWQRKHALVVAAQLIERVLPGGAFVGHVAVQDRQRGRLGPAVAIFQGAGEGGHILEAFAVR